MKMDAFSMATVYMFNTNPIQAMIILRAAVG